MATGSARKHVDGGLKNTFGNASHVIASVQALLHTESMVDLLIEDEEHRKTCRSLLKCMLCSLFKLYESMADTGIGDPSALIGKWSGVSTLMTDEKKGDPLQVLEVFIDVMRMEHVMRKPQFNNDDFHSSSMAVMWKSAFRCRVTCPSCGKFSSVQYKTSLILLLEEDESIESALMNEVRKVKRDTCMQCDRRTAEIEYLEIMRLAECLIVRVERCPSGFRLPLNLSVQEAAYDLRSVISEPRDRGQKIIFATVCPDGKCRHFDDTQVSVMALAKLCISEFCHQSRLTLVYERQKGTQQLPREKEDHRPPETTVPETRRHIRTREIMYSRQGLGADSSKSEDNAEAAECPMVTTCDQSTQTGRVFSYEVCKHNKKFKFFTGLCLEDFQVLYNLIGGDHAISQLKYKYASTPKKLRPPKICSEDKLFMFLLRLRRGLPLEELAFMFDCSVSSAGEICYAMTRLIYWTFKEIEMELFPSAEEQRKKKPKQMKPFQNLRILLDGVSFYIQTPTNFEQQGNTYSSYKTHNVLVFSVGISCHGATVFCSDGMEGSMSDKEVILKSGLLDRLQEGDGVMTDRGYELTAELQAIGCHFFKPPTLGGRKTFTAEEEILTKAIASARIYTEHAMADIKDNRLLQGVIPLTLLPVISDLVYIAAYLRNFSDFRIINKTIVPRECAAGDSDDSDT